MAAKKKAPVHKLTSFNVECGSKGWGLELTGKWSRTTCKNCLRRRPKAKE